MSDQPSLTMTAVATLLDLTRAVYPPEVRLEASRMLIDLDVGVMPELVDDDYDVNAANPWRAVPEVDAPQMDLDPEQVRQAIAESMEELEEDRALPLKRVSGPEDLEEIERRLAAAQVSPERAPAPETSAGSGIGSGRSRRQRKRR